MVGAGKVVLVGKPGRFVLHDEATVVADAGPQMALGSCRAGISLILASLAVIPARMSIVDNTLR